MFQRAMFTMCIESASVSGISIAQVVTTSQSDTDSSIRSKCFQCGSGVHEQNSIHESGSFGKNQCALKRVLRLSVVTWGLDEWQKLISERFTETASISCTSKFLKWLSEYRGSNKLELNIALTATHIINLLIELSTRNGD